jgi:hypothetical protein
VPCRRGRTGNCAAHPKLSTYGLGDMGGLEWGGLLADLVAVPHTDAMLVKLPAGIDPLAVASASDNIPDGWRTVGPQLAADPGAEVPAAAQGRRLPHYRRAAHQSPFTSEDLAAIDQQAVDAGINIWAASSAS